MKSTAHAILGIALASLYGHATVSFSFTLGGFQDAAGMDVNGMNVGIVVDVDGDGFSAGNSLGAWSGGFDHTSSGQYLPAGSGQSDDYYAFSNLGITSTEQGFGSPGWVGNITIVDLGGPDFSAKQFGLIWFNDNTTVAGSSRYGFVTDISWIMPGDGGNFINSASPVPGTAQYTFQIIPEPKTYTVIASVFAFNEDDLPTLPNVELIDTTIAVLSLHFPEFDVAVNDDNEPFVLLSSSDLENWNPIQSSSIIYNPSIIDDRLELEIYLIVDDVVKANDPTFLKLDPR
ncbi:MAG: hypothetical protein AB3N63_16410 [Puniceicoccaceae bacterium]